MLKRIIFFLLIATVSFAACNFSAKKIKGNGVIKVEDRAVSSAKKIKLRGSFDVLVQPADIAGISIQTDDNLLPYIITKEEDGYLIITTKKGFNISTNNIIQVIISTPVIESISLSGSGNIIGKDKFTGGNKLNISISGNGNVNLKANTPSVKASIAGSGDISISGETKDLDLEISGVGDFKGENLMTENAEIHINGSGNARVYAGSSLEVHISGVGNVYYNGNPPNIKKHVSGSGTVKQIEFTP